MNDEQPTHEVNGSGPESSPIDPAAAASPSGPMTSNGLPDDAAKARLSQRSPVEGRWVVAGGLGVVAALVWAVVAILRGRRRPETRSETVARLTQQAAQSGSEVAQHAAQEAARTGSRVAHAAARTGSHAAHQLATAAAPAAQFTAQVAAREGTRVGGLAAGSLGTATAAAGGLAASAAHSGQHVAESLAEVPGAVVEGVESVHTWVSRWVTRVLALLAFATGYVLGAQAGRERYEQIMSIARQATDRMR